MRKCILLHYMKKRNWCVYIKNFWMNLVTQMSTRMLLKVAKTFDHWRSGHWCEKFLRRTFPLFVKKFLRKICQTRFSWFFCVYFLKRVRDFSCPLISLVDLHRLQMQFLSFVDQFVPNLRSKPTYTAWLSTHFGSFHSHTKWETLLTKSWMD